MSTDSKKRLVVLISGSGSNLQAIIDACQATDYPAQVVAVISNKAGVYGLERAAQAGIETKVVPHTQFADRQTFDEALKAEINRFAPDLVVLAGFMRILTPDFVTYFQGKMLNIHPSLLPKYPGLHTHRRALEAKDSIHGVTVHFVTPELDGGPAILQAQVAIEPEDTEDRLAKRVLEREHVIYPMAVKLVAQDAVRLENGRAVMHGTTLPPSGHLFTEAP